MKTIFTFLALFFLATLLLQADVYVKGILHVDGGYRLGHMVPEINAVNEWWFDRDKVTFISTGWQLEIMNTDWRFTLDKEKKRILVINLTNSTFMDVSLQKNQVSYLDPSYIEVLSDFRFNGTVEKLNEKETYLEKTCDRYRVNEWMMEVDLRFYERERTILVTPDVPFNWKSFDELFHWIRSFFNPQPVYLSELKKIDGFIMKSDEAFMPRGGRLRWDFKVLEISHKEAPANIYDIPINFKKQEEFSRRDLLCLRTIVYPWPIY